LDEPEGAEMMPRRPALERNEEPHAGSEAGQRDAGAPCPQTHERRRDEEEPERGYQDLSPQWHVRVRVRARLEGEHRDHERDPAGAERQGKRPVRQPACAQALHVRCVSLLTGPSRESLEDFHCSALRRETLDDGHESPPCRQALPRDLTTWAPAVSG